MEAALSLGANMGDRLGRLKAARERLAALPDTELAACSAVYDTEPVDVRSEHADKAFLNAVVVLRTTLAPEALLDAVQRIETDLDRVRTADRNAPRPIDIDVLYVDGEQRADARLDLPHPRWARRRFVVQPLADVRPDRVLPGARRTVRNVLAVLPERPAVRKVAERW
jgi:2-amino-4-hydroxy-6-hydroxymethyldihydropteridine diphosphokinase